MGNKRVPEIRLSGVSGDWEERKLSEMLDFSNGINAPKESYGKGRKMISVMDVLDESPMTYKNIRNSVEVNKETEDKNSVEKGDLIFVRSSEVVEEVGWTKVYLEDEYALHSGFTIRGKKKNEYDAKFIELNLNSTSRRQIERKAGGSTRFNVSQSILKSIVIREPHIEEQTKLGNLFKRLDKTIAIHQQELETLKQTKQGFLQKMFPKDEETEPEMRFNEFSGAWEEVALDDIVDFSKGKGLRKDDVIFDGMPSILYGELFTTYTDNIDTVLSYTNVDMKNPVISKGNEILLPSSSTAVADAVTASALHVSDVILGSDINVLTPHDNKLTNTFGALMFNYPYLNDLKSLVQTGTITHLYNKDIRVLRVKLPKIEEQTKIGDFFKQLDDTIALHEQELETLKQTKKAFLQKMFV